MTMKTVNLICVVVFLAVQIQGVFSACKFPDYYEGSWYHREDGTDTTLKISSQRGMWGEERQCLQSYEHPRDQFSVGLNMTYLLKSGDNCFICMDVLFRSEYILQYRTGDCRTAPENGAPKIEDCPGYKTLPDHSVVVTLFKMESPVMDCIDSIEGLFQFSYEINEKGGGICNNSENLLEACQTPGSPNYDNKDFFMKYRVCQDVQTSFSADIRYKCMGSWVANINDQLFTFVGLVHDETGVLQNKYKCLMTYRDQHTEANTISWGLSRFGDCRNLKSLQDSPIRIVLKRTAPKTTFNQPLCQLPRNVSGTWFTQGIQFASNVWINDTHIYYRTWRSQFDYEEVWFVCHAKIGTRYLMFKMVVGRCEKSFACFDLAPRIHGIIRYRVGRSVKIPMDKDVVGRDSSFITDAFRESCSWQYLTFSRENVDWQYEVLIQDPPSPVVCPIGGRFTFEQTSLDFYELYETRIRGVTLSPRHSINCNNNVSEFKSCANDRTKLLVDAWYCETVDFSGKPIGEYDEPDHILTCAGFWMEDMKSYLITYDEEDAVSRYRCWVYERISWTNIALSRAENARCPKAQTSRSYLVEGARLYLQLTQAERLFDDCSNYFDPGYTMGVKPRSVYTLYDGSASGLFPTLSLLFVAILTSLFYPNKDV